MPLSRQRMRWPIVVAASIGLAVLVAVASLAARDGAADASAYRGSIPPGANRLPQFQLRGDDGRMIDTARLQEHVVLLTLLDAQCGESCPAIAWVVARAIDRLAPEERSRVRALALSADPGEDTPAAVEGFLRDRRATGRLTYLVGSPREMRPVWSAMQVLPSLDSGEDDLHSAPVRIYDRGLWVSTLHAGADLTIANLLHDIRLALRAQSGKE